MADSVRVRKLKARRKRVADDMRAFVRLTCRKLRHGDFDDVLSLWEAQFKLLSQFERRKP